MIAGRGKSKYKGWVLQACLESSRNNEAARMAGGVLQSERRPGQSVGDGAGHRTWEAQYFGFYTE